MANLNMDNKSKILLILFALAVLASVSATYYRYVILNDIEYATDEEAFQQSLLEE